MMKKKVTPTTLPAITPAFMLLGAVNGTGNVVGEDVGATWLLLLDEDDVELDFAVLFAAAAVVVVAAGNALVDEVVSILQHKTDIEVNAPLLALEVTLPPSDVNESAAVEVVAGTGRIIAVVEGVA